MPRGRRISPDGTIQHVINRGNRRATIFHKAGDYAAFFNLIRDVQDRIPMRILALCLMPNHFHLVLWPEKGSDLPAYMTRLMNAHVRRHQRHYGTTGLGHVYQGRYRNFIVQPGVSFYRVVRYVEANPKRAGLVRAAQLWRWSSLSRSVTPDGREYLTPWPADRLENWVDIVNEGWDLHDLDSLRRSVVRGAPYGDYEWTRETVKRYGLQATVGRSGRRPAPPPIVGIGDSHQ
jgi:putative transposase